MVDVNTVIKDLTSELERIESIESYQCWHPEERITVRLNVFVGDYEDDVIRQIYSIIDYIQDKYPVYVKMRLMRKGRKVTKGEA